jgi:hypothetical protein
MPCPFNFAPHLNSLSALLFENTPPENVPAVARQTEMLSYYLRGAYKTVHQMEEERQEIARSFVEKADPAHNVHLYLGGTQTDSLSFSLDFFLFCTRRLADSMIAWLSRCPPPHKNLPSSFNDLITGIRKGVDYGLDQEIQTSMLSYWDETGHKIKQYRDLANHYAILSGDCVVFRAGNSQIAIKMVLPDNPDEKSAIKLTYDPGVPVMTFMLESLARTVRFVNEVIERMIDLMGLRNEQEASRILGAIMSELDSPFRLAGNGPLVGEPVPYPLDISKIVGEAATIERKTN